MKQFVFNDMNIAVIEGADETAPEGYRIIDTEIYEVLKEVFEQIMFFGGSVESLYTQERLLREKVINKFEVMKKHYNSFNYGKDKKRATFIYLDSTTIPEAIEKHKEVASKKFGLDCIYVTYIYKDISHSKNEELLDIELAVINPDIVFVLEKREEVDEWVQERLKIFDTKYKA